MTSAGASPSKVETGPGGLRIPWCCFVSVVLLEGAAGREATLAACHLVVRVGVLRWRREAWLRSYRGNADRMHHPVCLCISSALHTLFCVVSRK